MQHDAAPCPNCGSKRVVTVSCYPPVFACMAGKATLELEDFTRKKTSVGDNVYSLEYRRPLIMGQ